MREQAGQAMLAIQNANMAKEVRLPEGNGMETGGHVAAQSGAQEQGSEAVCLAIMDAVDRAVPSSGESGGEGAAKEPSKKRRGREVQVVGGKTRDDIAMATETQNQPASDEEGEGL